MRSVPAIPEHLSMAAARKVAALKKVTLLFVERGGHLVGVIDEHALEAARDDAASVATTMAPIGTCLHPATPIARARDLFVIGRLSALPVGVGVFVLGAVTRADVEQALASAGAPAGRRAARWRAAA